MMDVNQLSIFILLAVTMCLFIWNRWRYDIVGGLALMAGVALGLVSFDKAFDGFSHPAVITVASVLVISKALQNSGLVEVFLRFLSVSRGRMTSQIVANCGIVGILSAFMNNIGALALMLPVSVRDARRAKRAPAKILMPIAFASLLGGLVTLIGTPPNIIIATIRGEYTGSEFSMFDFTPVGLVVAVAGLAFLVTIGWRLIPVRDKVGPGAGGQVEDRFQLMNYMTEARVLEQSPLIGKDIGHLEDICEGDVVVMAILRKTGNRLAPAVTEIIKVDDVLILQGHTEALKPLLSNPGLAQVGADEEHNQAIKSDTVKILEAIVVPDSFSEGKSVRGLKLHERYGVNILAVSRQGSQPMARLRKIKLSAGDVLLLQGEESALKEAIVGLGCMLLASKDDDFKPKRRAILTPITFAAAIAIAAATSIPVPISFTAAVLVLIISRAISLQEAYESIEWPIIILLGCLLPIGKALETTGATDLIAGSILEISHLMPVWAILALVVAVSMLLSDLVHNSPTAVLMAPIAISIAEGLNYSVDAFLMAVAIGAASPYLTPIGHQSNTLVMGPGGYRFGDYWRMGLPLDIVIVAVAVPMLMLVWG